MSAVGTGRVPLVHQEDEARPSTGVGIAGHTHGAGKHAAIPRPRSGRNRGTAPRLRPGRSLERARGRAHARLGIGDGHVAGHVLRGGGDGHRGRHQRQVGETGRDRVGIGGHHEVLRESHREEEPGEGHVVPHGVAGEQVRLPRAGLGVAREGRDAGVDAVLRGPRSRSRRRTAHDLLEAGRLELAPHAGRTGQGVGDRDGAGHVLGCCRGVDRGGCEAERGEAWIDRVGTGRRARRGGAGGTARAATTSAPFLAGPHGRSPPCGFPASLMRRKRRGRNSISMRQRISSRSSGKTRPTLRSR